MSLRLLFGTLAAGLSDWKNVSENIGVPETGMSPCLPNVDMTIYSGPAKFHIATLTISLITGLGFGGYVSYKCWMEKETFLAYIRNLVIALVCRTFFSIIFDGVVLLESPSSVAGMNTLSASEKICLNLVIAFWLSFTIYLHARVQRNFKSEPTLRLYQYGVPVVGVFFVFIWIFTLKDQLPNWVWWLCRNPLESWIVNSVNLLFLLVQLILVIDIARMMAKENSYLDNDSVSLFWRLGAVMKALVLLFWLQFGLSLALCPRNQSYLYFYYSVDGFQCALVCISLYFFNKWVVTLVNNVPLLPGSGETSTTQSGNEVLLMGNGDRGIVTIDSLFMTDESGKWEKPEYEEARDVVYSNVVEPLRLQKTLELYKRLNAIPRQVTVVEGEKFYDCRIPIEDKTDTFRVSQNYQDLTLNEEVLSQANATPRNDRACEKTQNKNAFYASKYLIPESKGKFPKYLETRPAVTSTSYSTKERTNRISIPDELLNKWFNDIFAVHKYDKGEKTALIAQEEQKKSSSLFEAGSRPKPVSETSVNIQDALRHQYQPSENIYSEIGDGGNLNKGKRVTPVTYKISDSVGRGKPTDLQIGNRLESVEQKTQDTGKVNHKDFPVGVNTEIYVSIPSKYGEVSVNAEEINKPRFENKIEELGPREVIIQPVDVSKSEPELPAQKQNEIASEDLSATLTKVKGSVASCNTPEPIKPQNEFLTYSQLQEYRSHRDKSASEGLSLSSDKKQSLTESIFSALDSFINNIQFTKNKTAGDSILATIKGVSDEERETHISRRLEEDFANYEILPPQTGDPKSNEELPDKEQTSNGDTDFTRPSQDTEYSEMKRQSKRYSDVIQLPSELTTERPTLDDITIFRPESITSDDSVPENESQDSFGTEEWIPFERQTGLVSDANRFYIRSQERQPITHLNIQTIRKPYPTQLPDEGVTSDLQENQVESPDPSSDSEFSIEDKETGSFSIESYCEYVMSAAAKFRTQQTPFKI